MQCSASMSFLCVCVCVFDSLVMWEIFCKCSYFNQIQDCSTDKTLIFVNQQETLNEQGQRCNPYFINKHTGSMRAAAHTQGPAHQVSQGVQVGVKYKTSRCTLDPSEDLNLLGYPGVYHGKMSLSLIKSRKQHTHTASTYVWHMN